MSLRNMSDNWLSSSQRASLRTTWDRLMTVVGALKRDRVALLSIAVIAFFTFITIFGPSLAPYDPDATQYDAAGDVMTLNSPTIAHPFGTTHLGQDIFSKWLHGVRTTLLVGLAGGVSVMIVGTNVGLIAGYFKGRIDLVLMRIVDITYGMPSLPLILVISMFLGASAMNIILVMILVRWRTMARLIRAQTLSISERPYVKAARAAGASDARIIYSHILPNVVPLIFIETVINVSGAIVLEAGVSFLGAGATETISLGTMLQMTFVTGAIREAWWWVLPPGISISLVVLSIFYISRAVEEITNPEITRFD